MRLAEYWVAYLRDSWRYVLKGNFGRKLHLGTSISGLGLIVGTCSWNSDEEVLALDLRDVMQ